MRINLQEDQEVNDEEETPTNISIAQASSESEEAKDAAAPKKEEKKEEAP